MRKRNWKLNVYLSHEERDRLMELSSKVGLPYAIVIRELIMGFEPKEKPPEQFYESLNYVRRTGNILNQMATKMHYWGYVEDVNFLRKTVNNLQQLVIDIREHIIYLLKKRIRPVLVYSTGLLILKVIHYLFLISSFINLINSSSDIE